ncbi:MAG TPA: proline racemase [Chloroflexi bacterium]|jgi:trans-L-3-hydroxyproline dehydratase|nr:proline racemase [Chloroflexota bacterium]
MKTTRVLTTIEAHAGGEPLRIVTSGLAPLRGHTILERRQEMLEQHDDVRRALMWEPRGHADMYGAILTPPVTPDADYGVLFMHNEGYSTMCGHGIIALTTVLIETGQFPATGERTTIGFDSPAGFIRAVATVCDGRVVEATFENVPSFVYADAVEVTTNRGTFTTPVVFGGAFYALVDAEAAGLRIDPNDIRELIDFGMAIKHAIEARMDVVHPLEPELRDIYGTIITGPPSAGADGRNVTIFADGEVDRSPCGTGTAARLAWLYATDALGLGEPWIHESIVGTRFTGRVLRETDVAGRPAIVPEIGGRGYLTGTSTFTIDPDDPVAGGFLVRPGSSR